MAYQKLQVSQGLDVIPSNTVDIPDVNSIVTPRVTSATINTGNFATAAGGTTTLTDAAARFTTAGIKIGAIVYNTSAGKAYTVKTIDSDTQLSLIPEDAGTATDDYSIYNEATNGCILYVGTAGNLAVVFANVSGPTPTLPGARLTFKNLPNASFMPTQVKRVNVTNTTASDIIALW